MNDSKQETPLMQREKQEAQEEEKYEKEFQHKWKHLITNFPTICICITLFVCTIIWAFQTRYEFIHNNHETLMVTIGNKWTGCVRSIRYPGYNVKPMEWQC